MFLLDTITKTIIAKTLAAPTADLEAVVHYNDVADYGANVSIGPTELTSTFDETYDAIVPSPVEFQKRRIVYISIYNQNLEAHTIVVSLYDSSGGTSTSPIFRGYLKQGWRAEYNVDKGWTVYNELGRPASEGDTRVLSQSAPGAVLTDIFTATGKTEVHKIIVANRAAVAKTMRVSIAPLGAADATSQYIYYDYSIAKNETKEINGIIHLDALDKIRVYGQDNNVTFTIVGKQT